MRDIARPLYVLILVSFVALPWAAGAPVERRWYKGNTHTHTLWSDGDAPPEVAADWYKSHGYHFLVLSDHNVMQEEEAWRKIGTGRRELAPERLQKLVERFGPGAATLRETGEVREIRLRTLAELRVAFQEKGKFIFIPGEEITDTFEKLPIHQNSMNHTELIRPPGGTSVQDVMERTIQAVEEVARKTGKPVLVHLNHPNFHWAIRAEDIAQVKGERFFEVYNGHRGVRNYGDAEHPGTEVIWDYVLTRRLAEIGGDVLYALATDDAHNYYGTPETRTSTPGRGWIWVRAEALTPEAILRAMNAGDFYASSGVALEDVVAEPRRLSLRIRAEEGVTYVTRFIGTRIVKGCAGPPGEVLAEAEGPSPSYAFRGDELYVRATVVSSRRHPNGYAPDDFETAWVQPVVVRRLAPR
jgi:hypothetical protein